MIGLLVIILFLVIFFQLTRLLLHAIGGLLGVILSIGGWLIIAGIAVAVFGLALYVLPVVLGVGAAALIAGSR